MIFSLAWMDVGSWIGMSATFTYSLLRADAECGSQLRNLGLQQSPAVCAMAAGRSGCTSFMHSSAYPVWGCRCCRIGQAANGKSHGLWDVYDVKNCDAVGVNCTLPHDVLTDRVRHVAALCADAQPDAGASLASARLLHDVLSTRETHTSTYADFGAAFSSAASAAAAALAARAATGSCASTPTACNFLAVALHQFSPPKHQHNILIIHGKLMRSNIFSYWTS